MSRAREEAAMTSSGVQVQDLIRASFLDGEWCRLGEPDDGRADKKARLIRRDPAETQETVAALGVFARHEPIVDEAEAVAQAWREDETVSGKFLTDLLLSAKDHRWHRARLRLRGARIA